MGTGLKFWTVSRAENFSEMFSGCASFVEAISFWNVENAVNMGSMFTRSCEIQRRYFSLENASKQKMDGMFSECEAFEISNLNFWDVSNVNNMEALFDKAFKFNKPIGDWNVSSVTSIHRAMFLRSPII